MRRKEDGIFSLSLTEIAFTLILLLVMLLGIRLFHAHDELQKREDQVHEISQQLQQIDNENEKLKKDAETFRKIAEQLGGICRPDPEDPIEPMMPCTKCVSVVANISKQEAGEAIALGRELLQKWKESSSEEFREYQNDVLNAAKQLAEGNKLVSESEANNIISKLSDERDKLDMEAGKLKEENETIKRNLACLTKEIESLNSDPNSLRRQLSELREKKQEQDKELAEKEDMLRKSSDQIATLDNQNKYLAKRAGFGYPPCWVNDEGKIQYLFNIELLPDDKVIVSRAWPAERDDKALEMVPVKKIMPYFGKTIDMSLLLPQAQEILNISNQTKPSACRHFVVLRNRIQDRATGDMQRLKIERYFYKREEIVRE
ncbi:hypothetical protein [uncultured Parasutterella sp.]|uniref:hypothetical protein n=3 Tax=uncultured Parasutterella sp. TaxID=1263098 RepID=UPI002599DBE6|nr:hypothetical protein [uncultured Parasutterella sp.]